MRVLKSRDGQLTIPSGQTLNIEGTLQQGGTTVLPMPPGLISAWMGGYFNGVNTGYADVLGNTPTTVNTYLNPYGWHVCNGVIVFDADSPIFNGAGRRVPDLTDDRFLMGSTLAGDGATTGSNTMIEHTHTVSGGTLTAAGQTLSGSTAGVNIISLASGVAAGQVYNASSPLSGNSPSVSFQSADHYHTGTTDNYVKGMGYTEGVGGTYEYTENTLPVGRNTQHQHTFTTGNQSANHIHTVSIQHTHNSSLVTGTTNINHSHGSSAVTGSIGTGYAAGLTENRPLYISCFYVMKIK